MNQELSESMKKETQKLYSIETQLVDGIKMLEKMALSEELKQALEQHRQETIIHVQRLETICRKMGWDPVGIPSLTLKAMQEEVLEGLNGAPPSSLLDARIIGAAQQVEHLEIAIYGTMSSLAHQIGDEESANLLGLTLDEEKQANEKLSQLAESGINAKAVQASVI